MPYLDRTKNALGCGVSINVAETRSALGIAAAHEISREINRLLASQETVRIIFAAAPSQIEMLDALAFEPIDWKRVEAFHMDEYVGLADDAPQNFRLWLHREFFCRVPLGKVNVIDPGLDPEKCASDYSEKLAEKQIDIVCLGIGVNGHLAFNDPPADFMDPLDVKIVELELASRQQQVDDGLFDNLDEVPTHAVSLSIPRLLRSGAMFCCAPGKQKRDAVERAFTGSIAPDSPASILRGHPCCSIYLDSYSAAGLNSYQADCEPA